MTERPSAKGLSCGRSKYFRSFQLPWVPREGLHVEFDIETFGSEEAFLHRNEIVEPMPFGATATLIAIRRLPEFLMLL